MKKKKKTEENNKMENNRHLFRKIEDIKGTFQDEHDKGQKW